MPLYRGMLAGVGLELGAIDADRANLAQPQMLGQLQHAHKRRFERLLVGGAKRADRVVIWVVVGAKVTHRHVAAARRLDRPGTKAARGVTIDQQHRRLAVQVYKTGGQTASTLSREKSFAR